MRIHRDDDGVIHAILVDKSGVEHPRTIPDAFAASDETDTLLRALQPFASRSTSYASQLLEAETLKRLARLIVKSRIAKLPATHAEWQCLVDFCYEHHLHDRSTPLHQRTVIWQDRLKKHFEYLRDIECLIPASVKIPPKRPFRTIPKFGGSQKTISGQSGQAAREPEGGKTFVNLDVSRTDAAYLEHVKAQLIDAIADVEADLLAYVTSMAEHFAYGQRLLAMCSDMEWEATKKSYYRLQTNMHDSPYNEVHRVLEGKENLPGSTEGSLGRILRSYKTGPIRNSVKDTFRHSRWLPSWQRVRFPDSCPIPPTAKFNKAARFAWMCGHISVTDLTVMHALLILHNPNFNAEPLFDSIMRDKNDRSNFELVVDGIAFSVDKRRSGERKSHTLDDVSQFTIETVLKMSEQTRSSMSTVNPLRNRLFYQQNAGGAKAVHYPSMYAFTGEGEHKRRIDTFLPRIAGNNAIVHINPARIRGTTAVLEWFKTGSITAAARKLGNTTAVVIKNYIPAALLHAWNTRLIRRFDNLFLCVATAHESYQLASTDFNSAEELHAFLTDMLAQHAPSSSKLAELLHERFASADGADAGQEATNTDGSGLVVPISRETLGILYAYREHIYKTGLQSQADDSEEYSLLPPSAAADLADLLCTRLPAHENPKFRKAHQEAVWDAERLIERIDANTLLTIRPLEKSDV